MWPSLGIVPGLCYLCFSVSASYRPFSVNSVFLARTSFNAHQVKLMYVGYCMVYYWLRKEWVNAIAARYVCVHLAYYGQCRGGGFSSPPQQPCMSIAM